MEALRAVEPTNPPYSMRYPKLARLLLTQDPYRSSGNELYRNVVWPGTNLLTSIWYAPLSPDSYTATNNLVGINPLILNPEGLSFQFGKNSPAFAIAFEQLPIERIGLYRDQYRRTYYQGR